MQPFRTIKNEEMSLVGWGVRVLLLTGENGGPAKECLGEQGGLVDTETEVYCALAAMIDDPRGYGVFIMDTQAFGGLAAGMRAHAMLRAADVRLPVILIASASEKADFPEDRSAPIVLRAPLSGNSMRVGFEHALHDRYFWRAA
jgi:hypothetical protein